MEQLTGPENLYLDLESESLPMHVSSLTIYDRSSAPGGKVEFHEIQRFFAERAHRSPVFRRRLVTLPLSLARPYWIDDPGFDIEFHLRHIALPKPGDWRQLCTQVARLHARPLDRNRPLWECYVIEELDHIPGLPPGSFALAIKMHYAALGGALGGQLFAALHELSSDSRASPPKRAPYFDHYPTVADLALRTAIDTLKRPFSLVRQLASELGPVLALGAGQMGRLIARAAGRRTLDAREHEDAAPRTRFNGKVSPHRVVDGVRFDVADIERIRDALPGATVNDVAIAIIGGALRRYLEGRLEPPVASLVAEVPIASRSETRIYASRTFADSAIMPIYSNLEDPVARLLAVVAETTRRKASPGTRLARRLALDAAEFAPAMLIGIAGNIVRRTRLGSLLSPVINTSIASIRGPDVPLYMAGARLVAYYGQAAVHDVGGLAHVVGYYDGAMTIGVTACRTMLPDPARYAQCLRASCDELGAALGVFEARRDVPEFVAIGRRDAERRGVVRGVPRSRAGGATGRGAGAAA
jgi:WS/DGAT/MGAT family acyltransferase